MHAAFTRAVAQDIAGALAPAALWQSEAQFCVQGHFG